MNKHSYFIVLALILTFAAGTRLYRLAIPSTYVFDEVYHAMTAKLYARNDPAGYEWWHTPPEPNTAIEWLHPPLAKLTQGLGIKLFGENSFGWRISSAVFGIAVIWATYLLATQLTKSKKIGVVAAGLAATDGLLLAQSRIAMNDIHLTLFIVLTLFFYSKWKDDKHAVRFLFLSGLCAGLSVATKWTGVFVIGMLFAAEFFEWVRKQKPPSIQLLAQLVMLWIVLPVMVYLLSFTQFWLQGHTIDQFKELHRQTWIYQVNLRATHPYQSTPIQWVFDLRPVWMNVDYSTEGKVGNIYNTGNPVVFLAGFIAMWVVIHSLTRKWNSSFVLLLIAYLALWLPWVFSPRIMFFYHYTPAVPLLCVALAWMVVPLLESKRSERWAAGGTILVVALLWFLVFYPNLTGILVPTKFADAVYFAIPSWK